MSTDIDRVIKEQLQDPEFREYYESLQQGEEETGESEYDIYDDIGQIMGEIDADISILGLMADNGRNQKANMYIRESIEPLQRALAALSDALFEITTS